MLAGILHDISMVRMKEGDWAGEQESRSAHQVVGSG